MNTMKYYVDAEGNYLGGWDDPLAAPGGSIEVPFPPDDARRIWDFETQTWSVLPPQPYTLSIALFWLRMTDPEAEDFDAAISTATPLRLRRAFNSAATMASDGELFGFVRGVLIGVTGETRADEIMGPPLSEESASAPAVPIAELQ